MKHVCRICIEEINDFNFLTFNTEEPSKIKMQLSFCVPEMVIDLVRDPVFCKSCVSALHSAYNFKNLCLRTEEHIKNLKTLPNESIDIKDVLYHLQQLTNSVCEDNSEGDNAREGFVITPNTNFLILKEDVANGQDFNTEIKTSQYSVTLPVDAFSKNINASDVTTNGINTADELSSLLDDAVCNTFVQPLAYKQEVKNEYKDITIDEFILVPKLEPSSSFDGYKNNSFDDAKSEDGTTDIENDDETQHFSCALCKFYCSTKQKLIKHVQVHKGEKLFACNVCTYRCAHLSTLKRHLQIHTGEKPFACNVCNFRSARRSDLQRHLRIHTGQRPFACNVCTFRSARKVSLQLHLRLHSGEKPFACSECKYRCAQKSNLKQHLRIHTDGKPYSCDVCTFRCAQSSTLQRHLRNHIREKP